MTKSSKRIQNTNMLTLAEPNGGSMPVQKERNPELMKIIYEDSKENLVEDEKIQEMERRIARTRKPNLAGETRINNKQKAIQNEGEAKLIMEIDEVMGVRRTCKQEIETLEKENQKTGILKKLFEEAKKDCEEMLHETKREILEEWDKMKPDQKCANKYIRRKSKEGRISCLDKILKLRVEMDDNIRTINNYKKSEEEATELIKRKYAELRQFEQEDFRKAKKAKLPTM